jgi:uncharacterized protein (TIGR02265 family)
VGEPRVKGVAFRTVDVCFAELRGDELHARAQKLMSSELADAFGRGLILAASWYPIGWYRETLRAFRAANNEGFELVRQIGYQSVRRDMVGTYKMMFARILSPQMLLSLAQRIFSTYYDTGESRVIESRRGHCVMRLHQCLGWDANMFQEIHGSSTALLELAGAKDVRIHIRQGGRDNDVDAEYEAVWT